jgi:hypothetical protein
MSYSLTYTHRKTGEVIKEPALQDEEEAEKRMIWLLDNGIAAVGSVRIEPVPEDWP